MKKKKKKNSLANAGDLGLILGWGRSLGEEKASPLQYSCLGNPMDRGAWWATVHGVAKVGHNLATKRKAKLSFVRIQEQKLSKINLQNKNGLNKYVLNSLPV